MDHKSDVSSMEAGIAGKPDKSGKGPSKPKTKNLFDVKLIARLFVVSIFIVDVVVMASKWREAATQLHGFFRGEWSASFNVISFLVVQSFGCLFIIFNFAPEVGAASLAYCSYVRILVDVDPMMPTDFLASIGALLLVVGGHYDFGRQARDSKVFRKALVQYAGRILLLTYFICHFPLEFSFRFISLDIIFVVSAALFICLPDQECGRMAAYVFVAWPIMDDTFGVDKDPKKFFQMISILGGFLMASFTPQELTWDLDEM